MSSLSNNKKPKKHQVTLADIARYVNVSPRTVSQVLSEHANSTTRVSEETAKKIREAATELNYRPNASARAMQGRGFKHVGFILEYEMMDGRVPPVIGMPAVLGIGDYLSQKDWNLSICREHRGGSSSTRLPLYLREHSVDGFIVNSSSPVKDEKILQELKRFDIPHVILNGASDCNSICLDDSLGIEQAMQHLIELGHRRIVYVGNGADTHHSVEARYQAYQRVMRDAGLVPLVWDAGASNSGTNTKHAGLEEKQSHEIVELYRQVSPSAFLCYSDIKALKISRTLLDAGIRVPEDVSIVGYDDLPYVYLNYPALTTVRSEFYKLGWEAAKMLLALIKQYPVELPSVCVKPELIVRNSTSRVDS